jgi:hypothetical protein
MRRDGTAVVTEPSTMRRRVRTTLLIVALGTFCTAACREDGMIQVTGLTFEGVDQVQKGH